MTLAMAAKELGDWLAELAAEEHCPRGAPMAYCADDLEAWRTNCDVALSNFPAGHPVRQAWGRVRGLATAAGLSSHDMDIVKREQGVIRSAADVLSTGRYRSVIDGVKVDTISEALDQADVLCKQGALIAAAVLAGGALETRLHELCEKNSLAYPTPGSIEKYNNALAAARKAGRQIVSQTDSKQITAWGGARNDAAHRPTEFTQAKPQVQLMIDGIRQFLERTR